MIYFIEHDVAGNIVHVCADPMATMVPLVHRVQFNDANGAPLKDTEGNDLSPFNSKMLEPVEVDETQYNQLMADGAENYTFDSATETFSKKASS